MTLSQKQQVFVQMIGKLIDFAYRNGYALTFGEAYRTPEQAAINAGKGIGIASSVHTSRLAVDFNLFINGEYQESSDAHRPLGEFWESIGGSWGGRFTKPDGNHYSIAHEGRK